MIEAFAPFLDSLHDTPPGLDIFHHVADVATSDVPDIDVIKQLIGELEHAHQVEFLSGYLSRSMQHFYLSSDYLDEHFHTALKQLEVKNPVAIDECTSAMERLNESRSAVIKAFSRYVDDSERVLIDNRLSQEESIVIVSDARNFLDAFKAYFLKDLPAFDAELTNALKGRSI